MEKEDVEYLIEEANKLYSQAKIEKNEDLFRKAFYKYEKATLKEPGNPWPFVEWGDALCELAKMEQYESLFEDEFKKYKEIIPPDLKDHWFFFRLGIIFADLAKIKQKDSLYDEATKNFKESRKDILEILTFLDYENRKEIMKRESFYLLLDSDNNDTFFEKTIKKFTQEQDITSEQVYEYKKIYIRSIFIISLLHINNENEKFVAYYREKNISQKLLFNIDSKFRLNAINYSNDPTEGKTLLDFLYGKGKYKTEEELNNKEYEAFAGCFTFNYDSLNQFRLYGKEDGKEGTGLSLVFKDSFFSKEAKMSIGLLEKSFIKDDRSPLYRCIYIDPQSKTGQPIITVGQKEEYLFYREEIGDKFKSYSAYINEILKLVREEMNELKKQAEKLNSIIVGQLLINLRYLVKHVAFKEEQECRIVKILNLTKDEENLEAEKDFNRMYFKYLSKVSDYIDKIYFGPKTEGYELFKSMLKYNGLNDIKCEKSTNPLA